MKVDGVITAVDLSLPGRNESTGTAQDKQVQADQANAQGKDASKANGAGKEENVYLAATVMNKAMKISNYHLQFIVHKDAGRVQVKVIDTDSNKVIREIPPDQLLDCSARIKEMIDKMAGILVNEVI